jgi:hypothetical protein
MNANQNHALPSILVQNAEMYIAEHAGGMTLEALAQWAYLAPAQDVLLAHLGARPVLAKQYYALMTEIDAKFSRGILTPSEYIEYHEEAALSMAMAFLDNGCDSIDLVEHEPTLIDDDVIHMWMLGGVMITHDWCDHMPWSPQWSMAKNRCTMMPHVEEATETAMQWAAGEWSAMYAFAETGVIEDLHSFCKELDECIDVAGDEPMYATRLYNLYLYACADTYEASFDNECF